ncbi:MAG: serpin family protein [Gemmatimonadaceae bacterium]
MFPRAHVMRLAAAAAFVSAAACSGGATDPGNQGGDQPDKPGARLEVLPRPLTAGESKVVTAANDFSFALFRRLSAAQKDSNVFTSPLSASMALGMAMNGAAGTTYDQMKSALAFGSASEQEINGSYKSLITLLRGLDPAVDFRIANSIWSRTGFPVKQTFIDATTSAFDAKVTALDFASATAPATINDWVSGATAGKIPKIIDRIGGDDVMFLINAIYFKGSWREKFALADTRDAQFRGVAGSQPIKLMHRTGNMGALYTPDFIAVDMPYGNSAFTMTALLPAEGRSVEALAASLQGPAWATWMGQMREGKVDLHFPRIKLEWERLLIPDLKLLGMIDAFNEGGADFSRLSSPGTNLFISVVKQKTYADVNEEGTEAAAVTNVGVTLTSAPAPVRFDRPFLFMIRERLSGAVVFMGKIVSMP